jgi:nitrite reductase/ring-hydroxylating ferredoxin subunit
MEGTVSPYPIGWFQLAYSEDLGPGEVAPLNYFGQKLVLFRTESGTAQVFNAICAHLGANLGYGGSVQGERLTCPFHGWNYDTAGQCVRIPYSDQIPRGASVRSWPTEESCGIVYVWHDPNGGSPRWPVPFIQEFGQPGWSGYQRHQLTVRTNVAEVVENVFDIPHAQFVHQSNTDTSNANVSFDFGDDFVTATFENDLPLVGGKTHHVVELRELGTNINHAAGVGSKAFLTSYTPIDETTLDVRFSFLTPDSLPTDPDGSLSRRSAAATVALFEQDIPIWEHMEYQPRPKLCAGDGPIGRYRHWIRKFYASAAPGAQPAKPAASAVG